MRIEVLEYRAFFERKWSGVLIGPLFGELSQWHGVTHLRARLLGPAGKQVGYWSAKGEQSAINTFGYATADEVLKKSFERAMSQVLEGLMGVTAEAPFVAASPSSPATLESGHRFATGDQYSWILGSWETVDRKSGGVDGVLRMEFKQEGLQVKWRMVRKGWMAGVLTDQEASGSVTRMSDSGIELGGKYDSSNPVNVVGQPVRYTLFGDRDILSGHEVGSDGTHLPLVLKRVR
jgi:hypothetical protein